jgi:MoaA/NifB/PqqE/SkfB family radical SAM enzyme
MKEHVIPLMSYYEFGRPLLRRALQERIPITGSMELTFRCNLKCAHCYCNLPLSDPDALKQELTTEECCGILDQIAEAGCLWLLLTGGEPFVRKDFPDIYIHAKKKGFIISLFTNGTLITPDMADCLAEWPPYAVEITLYGATKNVYERITRSPGSFKRCQRGIELLLEKKVPLDLKMAVMTLNKEEFWQVKDFAKARGLKFRYDTEIAPRLDGRKTPCLLRLPPQEVVALDAADEKRTQEWREEFRKCSQPTRPHPLYPCGAGLTTFHIDPYGKLNTCDMCRFEGYNLRIGTFREGWNSNIPGFLDVRPRTNSPCHTCTWIEQCNHCPGWAWAEHGNLEEPVEYQCEITRLRAETFA